MVFKLFESLEEFLDESANLIFKIYKESITKYNQFSLMLSGGNTPPKPLFEKKLLKITTIKSIGKEFLCFGLMKDTSTKKVMIVIINGLINCYFQG